MNRYVVERKLGSGAFGVVNLARRKADGKQQDVRYSANKLYFIGLLWTTKKQYAIKQTPVSHLDASEKNEAEKEARILLNLKEISIVG